MNTPNKQAELYPKKHTDGDLCKEYFIGLKQGKAQALADVMKIIDSFIEKSNKEKKDNYLWYKYNLENLKAKLQSPQETDSREMGVRTSPSAGYHDITRASDVGSEDTNIQKAISEFKEKLKERIDKDFIIFDNENRLVTKQKRMFEIIEKTAQEMK